MSNLELMYIEKKAGYSDDGPAWIAYVQRSKSGRTIYFNGMAFKSLKGSGISGNFYELSSGDEYWISGPKKNGGDRHWIGGGKVYIQDTAVEEYLKLTRFSKLHPRYYEVIRIENEPYDPSLDGLENHKEE